MKEIRDRTEDLNGLMSSKADRVDLETLAGGKSDRVDTRVQGQVLALTQR